uniref:O-acyltransferase n=1 Tax=Globodera pallida TaxID=36090 RepID=A0A183C324_GLOPA
MNRQVHVARDSLFSTSSGWTNYRGFFNLAFLLLVVSNGRVALENLIKYGILISPLQWVDSLATTPLWCWPNLYIVLCLNFSIIAVYILERLLAKDLLINRMAAFFYVVIFGLHLAIPPFVILLSEDGNPLFSFGALTAVVVVTLKLISYGHVNSFLRAERDSLKNSTEEKKRESVSEEAEGEEQQQKTGRNCVPDSPLMARLTESSPHGSPADKKLLCYPFNLTIGNLYYFMFAPTLCYELYFPRTPARRKRFIFKRIIELVGFSFVIVSLSQQWVMPLVKNSLAPFSEMDVKRCVERVLKLAIPNHLIWLMCFYLFFHSFLNLIAELLCFADREFYLDFWNSESVATFWKTWNIPVHRWAIRHMYRPFVRNGWGRWPASLAVFATSAFFHEYLVSVPLKMFRLWACTGMLAQIPLGMFTDQYLKAGRAGNIVVWLSLILGQPMAILMYVHDWYLLHHPELHAAHRQNLTIAHF